MLPNKWRQPRTNLEENVRLPHGISAILDAFRLGCAQICPISSRISARVPGKKMGYPALLPRIDWPNAALLLSIILPNIQLRPHQNSGRVLLSINEFRDCQYAVLQIDPRMLGSICNRAQVVKRTKTVFNTVIGFGVIIIKFFDRHLQTVVRDCLIVFNF